MGEERFTLDQYLYINHSDIAQGEDVLSMNAKKRFWVARLLEIRGTDQEHTYLRVFWLYWPEELQGGASPYHGKNELVMSNHMDTIDARTVAGHAEVQHWLEDHEEENPTGMFWRQTLNTRTQQLSVCFLISSVHVRIGLTLDL